MNRLKFGVVIRSKKKNYYNFQPLTFFKKSVEGAANRVEVIENLKTYFYRLFSPAMRANVSDMSTCQTPANSLEIMFIE